MKKEWKTKWIEALRSGKYTQTFDKELKRSSTIFCATGILFEIYDPSRWFEKKVGLAGTFWVWGDQNGKDGYLDVLKFLEDMDIISDNFRAIQLMNDYDRKTFNEIADWIEVNL